MVDLERFTAWANEMVDDRIPPVFLKGLTGGIVVVTRARRNPDDPPDIYILGEYITDDFGGCHVALYYGSFKRLFRGEAETVWREELWQTITHELRHHVEQMAGMGDLDLEDMLELERWRDEEKGR